jgi:hypothetical protein
MITEPRRNPEDINLGRIQSDLEFLIERVSKLPTRRELIRPMPSFASLLLIALSLPAVTSASELDREAISLAAPAAKHRSRTVAREFQREHPCPSTGLPTGPCPGYWKDHIVPLACGGPDAVANLQWQTISEARPKDGLRSLNGLAEQRRRPQRRLLAAVARGGAYCFGGDGNGSRTGSPEG